MGIYFLFILLPLKFGVLFILRNEFETWSHIHMGFKNGIDYDSLLEFRVKNVKHNLYGITVHLSGIWNFIVLE